jgi:hypothetical protein
MKGVSPATADAIHFEYAGIFGLDYGKKSLINLNNGRLTSLSPMPLLQRSWYSPVLPEEPEPDQGQRNRCGH